MTWPDRMLATGAFLSFFSGYLFLKGPAVNPQQLGFRIGLLAVGLILAVLALVLKASGGKRDE